MSHNSENDSLRKTAVQLIRYGFTGGLAFTADFVIMILLVERLNVAESLAATLSFCVGLTITYILSILWVFDERRFSSRLSEFLLFALIGIIGMGMTYLLMSLGIKLGINYILSKIIVTGIVSLWNFFAKKFLLFSKKE